MIKPYSETLKKYKKREICHSKYEQKRCQFSTNLILNSMQLQQMCFGGTWQTDFKIHIEIQKAKDNHYPFEVEE